MKRVLVADDERQITRMLRASLQGAAYAVSVANDGMEAYQRFLEDRPDLIITDLAMPEMDGVELTRSVRRQSTTPIIVLSVRDTEVMKVSALDAGADDYLTKPFSMQELLARVRVQLRRTAEHTSEQIPLAVGDFVIDVQRHACRVREQPIHLTPKEFDLLLHFARNPGRVLTHKVLLRSVWGTAGDDQPEYIRVLVAQLRRKIELEGPPRYIISEPWVGYRFEPEGGSTSMTS